MNIECQHKKTSLVVNTFIEEREKCDHLWCIKACDIGSISTVRYQEEKAMYRLRSKLFRYFVINGLLICLLYGATEAIVGVDECQATRVIHFLQYPGCVPKPIPSYACRGRCSSYLQVSGSKMWQMERSCMCCQESGEREASVSLFCPRAKPGEKKFRKMVTKAPLDCMCRPCTSVEEYAIIPQEIAGFADEGPFTTSAHFRRASGLQ
ncbi:PREDICTED: bursicon [Atta colombica]|nr:PREDICTED: bursicon [Atta colombica]